MVLALLHRGDTDLGGGEFEDVFEAVFEVGFGDLDAGGWVGE